MTALMSPTTVSFSLRRQPMSCMKRQATTKVMPSGAGHDAQAMAQLGPMGMIFIPSVGGISHSPKEFSKPEDIVNGANVLINAVMALDGASFT